jgi:diadenosine tetraphosphate (Ap4A) HIT family hydrolase
MSLSRVPVALEYRPSILKEYKHWTLLLHERQRYLGRAVVWLARPGQMQRFSDLTHDELLELQTIIREYEHALLEIGWNPDHVNYMMLGNFFHEHGGHGHMHIVPRYAPRATPLAFDGTVFCDDKWGKNCTPETPFVLLPEMFQKLVSVLRTQLG